MYEIVNEEGLIIMDMKSTNLTFLSILTDELDTRYGHTLTELERRLGLEG